MSPAHVEGRGREGLEPARPNFVSSQCGLSVPGFKTNSEASRAGSPQLPWEGCVFPALPVMPAKGTCWSAGTELWVPERGWGCPSRPSQILRVTWGHPQGAYYQWGVLCMPPSVGLVLPLSLLVFPLVMVALVPVAGGKGAEARRTAWTYGPVLPDLHPAVKLPLAGNFSCRRALVSAITAGTEVIKVCSEVGSECRGPPCTLHRDSEVRKSRSSPTEASAFGREPLQKRLMEGILQMVTMALPEAGRKNPLYLCSVGTHVL